MSTAAARVARLLAATRRAVAPGAARDALVRRLEQTTGLSRPNIQAALDECLELEPSPRELEALLASVQPAPRAHVILPSNVFVAAHRALAPSSSTTATPNPLPWACNTAPAGSAPRRPSSVVSLP